MRSKRPTKAPRRATRSLRVRWTCCSKAISREAQALFRAVAEEREEACKTAGREAAEAWRNLGAIAALSDPKKSREAYAHAVALEPDDVDGLIWHGWLQIQANDLPVAEEAYRRLIALESGREPGFGLYWARVGTRRHCGCARRSRRGESFIYRGSKDCRVARQSQPRKCRLAKRPRHFAG